jgi:hypothetical protein
MLTRFARWVLRHELAALAWQAKQWKQAYFVEKRYRQEVLGETPANEPRFREWFFATYPKGLRGLDDFKDILGPNRPGA